ncbi:formimidoylglutamate deiminase [Mesorhizobium microcysteis]|uniref:Formimidoylglutamate deiminase n=1 Tax=Neoaquamicrobium microcysteis TaxID=2682781 RepID=A0A5D4GU78_9HYPH|nr:formimidoylglutamate deiminase [Mesorhizobium microcysteis]TYR32286.1 formimidoylglutamate deiminase [Mesorhizobium microcysteis]
MTVIFANEALTASGWQRNVALKVSGGRIEAIDTDATPGSADERCAVLLPTVANLHSHAFQRAMAGMAERRGPTTDTFWTWREVMYRHALTMTPEQVEATALMLYVEMLEAGFGRVGEFHYLHHAPDGTPYANMAEMAERIAAASAASGIGLTLLPVFYAHSTFGGHAPAPGQRRFINDVDGFGRLLESSRKAVESLSQALMGAAPHSLRAVTPEELAAVAAMATGGPLHIHVAEQVKEVEDCVAWSGARPVEWLLANAPVDERWCFIHATHMNDSETAGVAQSGAVAGLCPVTEANLGDGIFQGPLFAEHGGRYGVGSDSNVLIGLSAELRQFEYAQRLGNRARNVMAGGPGSTGRALFDAVLKGGAQALGVAGAGIAIGEPADFFSLDVSDVTFEGKKEDAVLDAFVFAGAGKPDSVWIGGNKLVENGRHRIREEAERGFRKALRELAEA